eukprot:TRINITY_DN76620_c0_g1_i1.p1 TRINITY_DN76620_c0_g1~~TRINITY_DN76620_c0_g1_i1.p1  ORF type:complete len:413 (+),score=54.45 TRINITY_DN76620_c0_g1_i1:209-1447(+)
MQRTPVRVTRGLPITRSDAVQDATIGGGGGGVYNYHPAGPVVVGCPSSSFCACSGCCCDCDCEDDIPGPGAYDIQRLWSSVSSYRRGAHNRRFEAQENLVKPTAAAWRFGKAIRGAATPRRAQGSHPGQDFMETPGPDAYLGPAEWPWRDGDSPQRGRSHSVDESSFSHLRRLSGSFIQQRAKGNRRAPTCVFGNEARGGASFASTAPVPPTGESATPGPDAYSDASACRKKRPESPAWRFGSASRARASSADATPGPGAYFDEGSADDFSGSGGGRRSSSAVVARAVPTTFGTALRGWPSLARQKSVGSVASAEADGGPGPGSYRGVGGGGRSSPSWVFGSALRGCSLSATKSVPSAYIGAAAWPRAGSPAWGFGTAVRDAPWFRSRCCCKKLRRCHCHCRCNFAARGSNR